MTRSKQVMAVVMVAAALSADRAIAAAPAASPHIMQAVRQIASKLTCGFRSELPDMRPQPARQSPAPVMRQFASAPALVPIHTAETTAFQFRLPPPTA